MILTIPFFIDLNQHMALPLSSHGSLDRNLMNHDRLRRRYDFKFITCGLESLKRVYVAPTT
ncbi:hypothetical protein CR513_20541, partial [Mucuna pruriens]